MAHDRNGVPTPFSAYAIRFALWLANVVGALLLPAIAHVFSRQPVEWLGPDLVAVFEAVLFFAFVDVCVAAFWKNGLHPKLTHPLTAVIIGSLVTGLLIYGGITYALAAGNGVALGASFIWLSLPLVALSLIAEAFVAMLEHDKVGPAG